MKRVLLGLCLLPGLLLVPHCAGRSSDEGAPLRGRDLLLVVSDSVDAAHVGAYGYSRDTTPFLDELAASGAVLERAVSQTSWTLSSVASLLTGLEQEAHGVTQIEQSLPLDGPTTLGELFRRRGYRTVGLVQNAVLEEGTGLDRGFDRFDYVRFTDEGADDLVRIVGEEAAAAPEDRPLFMYVHVGPPHMPYRPPEPFLSRYSGAAPESRMVGSIRDTTSLMVEKVGPDHPDVLRLVELYDGHLAYADSIVRRAVEAFQRPSQADGSSPNGTSPNGTSPNGGAAAPAVLVTSDHGEAFMQHGAIGHNLFCYEPMVRIPWILSAPGVVPAGVRVDGTGSILDVLPTLSDLFGLPVTDQRPAGRSLSAALLQGAAIPERPLLLSSRYPRPGREAQLALVEGPWKLVVRRRGQSSQLFHTAEDPEEVHDLAAERPDQVARMEALLQERRAAIRGGGTAARRRMSEGVLEELESLGYGGADGDGGQREAVGDR